MNPLALLVFIAPAAVLGVVVFTWVYEDQTERHGIERQKHEIRQMEFDRDFAKAWNGEALDAPDEARLAAARAELEQSQERQVERERERCERLSRLASELDPSESDAPSC